MTRYVTRSDRRARTERVQRRRWRDVTWTPARPEMFKGRCRKVSPFDCGNPRCFACHHNKILGTPRPSDVRRALADLNPYGAEVER